MAVRCLGVNFGSFRMWVRSAGVQFMARERAVQERSGSALGLAMGLPEGGNWASHTAKRLCQAL